MTQLTSLLFSVADPATLLRIILIILFAYTVFGLTGFGSSIVAIPFLIQVLPLHVCVALMLLFDLVTSVLLNLKTHKSACWAELRRVLPGVAVGALIGLSFSLHAPTRWILLVLGLFIIAMFLYNNFFAPKNYQIRTLYAFPLSLCGGTLTTLFGTGGPLYAIYLAGRIPDVRALRATLATLISITVLLRLLLFTAGGIMSAPSAYILAIVLLPVALLGLVLGSKLHPIIPPGLTKRILWLILLFAGINLLVKAV